LGRMLLSFTYHPLDFFFVQSRRSGDLDGLLLASTHILRGYVDDAVGINIEGNLDLRHSARSRGYPHEIELPQQLVVSRHLALALKDPDCNRGLVVLRGGEDLTLARRNSGVLFDQLCEHPSQSFNPERKRRHVE